MIPNLHFGGSDCSSTLKKITELEEQLPFYVMTNKDDHSHSLSFSISGRWNGLSQIVTFVNGRLIDEADLDVNEGNTRFVVRKAMVSHRKLQLNYHYRQTWRWLYGAKYYNPSNEYTHTSSNGTQNAKRRTLRETKTPICTRFGCCVSPILLKRFFCHFRS